MKAVVVTTSYPRGPGDVAGAFVRDAVEALRAEGVEIEVVSPATCRHFGLAYGDGITNNLRRRPWLAIMLPLFAVSLALGVWRSARRADIVWAHWLPTVVPALAARRPVALQVWGSDLALARRAPAVARWFARRADVVVAPSEALASDLRRLGVHRVRVIAAGVRLPDEVAEPSEPPHALYLGRLSAEKGVGDLAEAARGLPLVVVGEGPLATLFPSHEPFVAPALVGQRYAQASVVVVPSRREGYGMVAREAMAHGRPVVATGVGGLLDAVEDGVTGLLVSPRSPAELRAAIETLLRDRDLRLRLGTRAREVARERFSLESAARATLAVWREVVT